MLTKRELGTVLAALRFWQEEVLENGIGEIPQRLRDTVGDDPLELNEVADLCTRLNCDDIDLDDFDVGKED